MSDDPTQSSGLPTGARARIEDLPALRVVVVSGPDAGAAMEVNGSRAVIGRAAGADVALTDPTVSQFHAELRVTPAGIAVTDLGSRNGTRAGDIVLQQVVMPVGAVIHVGSTALRLEVSAVASRSERSAALSFGGLVGGSLAMREVYAMLERLARTDLGVLLEGETGTGKEVAARALHEASRRASGPFLVLDCTTVPPTLAESVLFGHEKGAFTGAQSRRAGIFEAASGGTLLLDEIGELTADLQPKLLRVLERREIVSLGSTQPRPINVRIVSATWRDLRTLVNRGAFREDLYYRLAQAQVRLPSLAARPEDIGPLVAHFLAKIPWDVAAARAVSAEALAVIASRTYAGNLRELKNTVERAAMLAAGATITPADLAFERVLATEQRVHTEATVATPEAAPGEVEPFKDARRTVVEEFERAYLDRLLERAGTNISKAARLARVDRQTLRELLTRHGLRTED